MTDRLSPLHRPDPSAGDFALPDPERVDPAVLTTLLARHGWQRRGGAPGRYTRWTPPGDTGTSLLVPERQRGGQYADHTDLLAEALTALARSGAPSARDVLTALTVPGDEIRWIRDMPRVADAVPWPAMRPAPFRRPRHAHGRRPRRTRPHAATTANGTAASPPPSWSRSSSAPRPAATSSPRTRPCTATGRS